MVMNRFCVLSASIIFLIYFVIFISWSTFINQVYQSKATINSFPNTNRIFSIQQTKFSLNCINGNKTKNCPKDYHHPFLKHEQDQDYYYSSAAASSSMCPEYFKWIHEDLKPWKNKKSTGITREVVERGKNLSDFRLVIVKGKAYIEKYRNAFQTRDVFTIWGILQLLRLYPGKIPDLELMFHAGDLTVVKKEHFQGPNAMLPAPVFHYCGRKNAFDIVFPDWSFWGWGELGIRPWEATLKKIQEGNKKTKWKDRIPFAFWKGNIKTSSNRYKLKKCNTSNQHDWNARLYSVQWGEPNAQGFQDTKLEDQCTHRYKIYVEGVSWSVSEKYILACDSMTLFIEPKYYDFFTRSMVPMKHYWPISSETMCQDVKYAVDWGNTHPDQAEEIGISGSSFIEENLKMKFVYGYMFHLLNEYARLLRFKPTTPPGAKEICSETVACPMGGLWRQCMVESMVRSPSDTPPCTMPTKNDEDKGHEQHKL